MIKIDIRKPKRIEMVYESAGVDMNKTKIYFDIIFEKFTCRFECSVVDKKIIVDIPVLEKLINNIKENATYKCQLCVLSGKKTYVIPYKGDVVIGEDINIDVKLHDDLIVDDMFDSIKEIAAKKISDKHPNKKIDEINTILREDLETPIKELVDKLF